jgi:hypothetical protein
VNGNFVWTVGPVKIHRQRGAALGPLFDVEDARSVSSAVTRVVRSTEASDGRLARVGRIAASALYEGCRGAPQRTLKGSGWSGAAGPTWQQFGNSTGNVAPTRLQYEQSVTRTQVLLISGDSDATAMCCQCHVVVECLASGPSGINTPVQVQVLSSAVCRTWGLRRSAVAPL